MNKRINRYSAEASAALPNACFLLACAAVAFVLLRDASGTALVLWRPEAEYWGYLAVLQQWLQNPAALSNPLVRDAALSAQFVPLFWLLAGVGRLLGMDAMQLMTAAGLINFVLLATGLKLFLGDYFRHSWAAFLGLLVLFCGWGLTGSGPGVYQLRNFLQIAADPSTFAFALSLIAFWVTMRLLRSDATMVLWALALLLLVALVFVSHPLSGLFCVLACGLLAVTEFATSLWGRLAVFVAAVAGLAAAELWPFFSVWKLTLGLYPDGLQSWSADAVLAAAPEQHAARHWAAILYDPSALLAVLGVSLLGLLAILRLLQRGEQPFIVYGAALMLLPYAFNLVVDVPLAHRFLLNAVFFLQLALVWGWLRLFSLWSEMPRSILATPMLLLSLAGGAAMLGANYWLLQQNRQGNVFAAQTLQLQDSRSATAGLSVPALYRELLAPLSDAAVVLAPPATGWPVPAFRGRVVALLNPNPLLPDMSERQTLTREFFYAAPTDLQRVATVQRYAVSHVLLNQADADLHRDLQTWLNSYGRTVTAQGDYRVYELAPALQQIRLPQPATAEAEPVEAAAAAKPAQPESPPAAVQAPADSSAEAPQATEETAEPRQFGAPIAAPVLDPERHGG